MKVSDLINSCDMKGLRDIEKRFPEDSDAQAMAEKEKESIDRGNGNLFSITLILPAHECEIISGFVVYKKQVVAQSRQAAILSIPIKVSV